MGEGKGELAKMRRGGGGVVVWEKREILTRAPYYCTLDGTGSVFGVSFSPPKITEGGGSSWDGGREMVQCACWMLADAAVGREGGI